MSDTMKEILSWLGILGIPSIFSMTIWCIKSCRKYSTQLKILLRSQQAQMRAQMLKDYAKYMSKGYISDIELNDWTNQYDAYHELGANGVLDSRRDALLKLPSEPPSSTNQQ